MDLENKVSQLESEKVQYLNIIDNINAEKIALDQMLVENLKMTLSVKKELIIINQNSGKTHEQLCKANNEIEELKKQLSTKPNKLPK